MGKKSKIYVGKKSKLSWQYCIMVTLSKAELFFTQSVITKVEIIHKSLTMIYLSQVSTCSIIYLFTR